MPKISDEKRAARRAQILEAAWACFQREGLHATTMDDIIRASGLSAGAVYSYYPSKSELILAAVTTSLSGFDALVRPLLQAEPALPPGDLLRRIAATIDRFTAREGYDLKRIALLGWSEAQRNEQLRTTMQAFYQGFRAQLAAAVTLSAAAPAGQADATAKALLSLILGYVVQSAVMGDMSPDDLVLDLGDKRP
jgi:AcrR family transcriptional regulator